MAMSMMHHDMSCDANPVPSALYFLFVIIFIVGLPAGIMYTFEKTALFKVLLLQFVIYPSRLPSK